MSELLLVWRPKGKGGTWTPATIDEAAAWAEHPGPCKRMPSGQSYVRDADGVWRRWEGAA